MEMVAVDPDLSSLSSSSNPSPSTEPLPPPCKPTVNSTIRMGDYVILSTFLGKKLSKLVKVEETGDVHLKKERINLRTLIGDQFDSIYRLDRATHQLNNAGLTQEQLRDILDVTTHYADLNFDDDTKDNRFINDDGSSQKLDRDGIEALKKKGASGDDIIRTLVENSSTFKDRNVFSQEKYLKKKQAKYSNLIRVQKPTPSLLADMYYTQGPMKINNLRLDSLYQMLSACNVRSGCKYMVIDTNMGLLTAAVLDRLVGDGSMVSFHANPGQCIQLYLDDGPVTSWRQSVDALNLPPEVLDQCLSSVSIRKLYTIVNDCQDAKNGEDMQSEETDPPIDSTGQLDDFKRRKLDEKTKRKAQRKKEDERAIKTLLEKEMDGLLIITRNHDPTEILTFLYQFLSPSQPFAVFSIMLDPLLSCFQSLRGSAINSKISETWFRQYQVLPSRTRPEMNMSGSGGYLLTGIKVAS